MLEFLCPQNLSYNVTDVMAVASETCGSEFRLDSASAVSGRYVCIFFISRFFFFFPIVNICLQNPGLGVFFFLISFSK